VWDVSICMGMEIAIAKGVLDIWKWRLQMPDGCIIVLAERVLRFMKLS